MYHCAAHASQYCAQICPMPIHVVSWSDVIRPAAYQSIAVIYSSLQNPLIAVQTILILGWSQQPYTQLLDPWDSPVQDLFAPSNSPHTILLFNSNLASDLSSPCCPEVALPCYLFLLLLGHPVIIFGLHLAMYRLRLSLLVAASKGCPKLFQNSVVWLRLGCYRQRIRASILGLLGQRIRAFINCV